MYRIMIVFLVLSAPSLTASAADNVLSAEEKSQGFILLFDGKSLDNWTSLTGAGKEVPADKSDFSVKDQAIFAATHDTCYWIRFNRVFDDCVVRLEYKLSKKANSGIFLRVPGGKAHPAYSSFEVQLLDDHSRQPSNHTTGSIYDVITPMRNMSKPAGEWNSMEITCHGSRVAIVHNGFKIVDVDFATLTKPLGKFSIPYAKLPRSGYFGLQTHGGQIAFKNIRVKPLHK